MSKQLFKPYIMKSEIKKTSYTGIVSLVRLRKNQESNEINPSFCIFKLSEHKYRSFVSRYIVKEGDYVHMTQCNGLIAKLIINGEFIINMTDEQMQKILEKRSLQNKEPEKELEYEPAS